MRTPQSTDAQFPPLLRKCWMRLNALFQKRVAAIGLTPDQYIALRWLNELPSGTVYQLTLKKLMFTDPNNIAGLMARMERMGLIERRADVADRRKSSSFVPPRERTCSSRQGKLRSGLRKRRWPFSPNQKEKSFSDCWPRSIGVFIPNDRGIASHLQANPFSPAASAVHSAIGISGGVQFSFPERT